MKTQVPVKEIILSLFLSACVPTVVAAQGSDGYPANWCRNGLFSSDEAEFRLATVGGNRTARTHFYNDDDGCPSAAAKCETKSYLIAGDRVVVSRKYGPWVCAWYQKGRGAETVGWLRADKLVMSAPPAAPALKDWLGSWEYAGNSLDIRRDAASASLKVKGEAVWQGVGDNVHVGSVEAVARPRGNELILVEEECRVRLKLVGDYLIVSDNSECGGANVRFNGVFRKSR
jgi:hypothetical protein